MQQREKILLGGLIVVVVFWWARPVLLKSFIDPIEEKKQTLSQAENRLETKQAEQDKVLAATRQLTEWRSASLPANPYEAQRAYTAWLTDLIEASGWASLKVTPGKITRFEDLGSSIQVRIEGVATSSNLASFLNLFENAGVLHRLERMTIDSRSIQPGELLDLSLAAEAISLQESTREDLEFEQQNGERAEVWQRFAQASPFSLLPPEVQLTPTIEMPTELLVHPGETLNQKLGWTGFSPEANVAIELTGDLPEGLTYNEAERSLQWETTKETPTGEYSLTVLAKAEEAEEEATKAVTLQVRYPNTPPQLASVPPQVAYTDREWTYRIEASDMDEPKQTLTYRIEGDHPEGLSIDSATGQLHWTPPLEMAGQTANVRVAVTDSGTPSQTASADISIQVEKNFVPTTQLVGCLQVDGKWTAWFRERDSGTRYQFPLDGTLEVSFYQGTITEIDVDHIILKSDGTKSRLSVGQSLNERQTIPTEDDQCQ